MFKLLTAGLLAFVTSSAFAQKNDSETTSPTSAGVDHQSVFDDYRPYAAQAIQNWQQSNETVARIGGWRAYAREIQAAKRSERRPNSPVSSPRSVKDTPK
jgi:hypothetical protein